MNDKPQTTRGHPAAEVVIAVAHIVALESKGRWDALASLAAKSTARRTAKEDANG